MRAVPRILEQQTLCHGVINGQEFEFTGGGSGRPYDGEIETTLETRNGPVKFDTHLFDVILIMGYPTYSLYARGTHDLFKISNGYEYSRRLTFENGGEMESVHAVEYSNGGVSGDFHVEKGEVETPVLTGIEPLVETFVPAGPGRIMSYFTVAWNTEDDGHFTARCESEYRLTHNAELPFVQFRYVTIVPDHTPERLAQKETLTVIRDLPQVAGV